MTITLSILNGFSKFFYCRKPSSILSVCCRTTLRKLEVWNCGNIQKTKNRVTFDKNRNVSCNMAEYCHNSCSKCPPFARMHARRRPCIVNDGLVNAMPNNAENAASVHNTCLENNLAIANRSRLSCAHNTLRAYIGLNITPWPWNLQVKGHSRSLQTEP